jgi:hypothetical protein
MRMKSLLGLLAIGGAVAYAQKKRGGELTVDGFKKTFREMFNNVNANKSAVKPSSGMRASDEPSYSSQGRAGTTTGATQGSDFGDGPNGTGRSGIR